MSSSSTVKNKVASKEKVSLAKLAKYNPLNNDMQLFRASLWEVIKDYEPKLKALYQDAISSKTRLPRDDERCYCPVIILLLESVHKQVIKAINWKNFPMSGEVFLTFISFCEKYNTLNTLRLEDSCLQEDDITLLAIFLRSNSNVTDLNLSGNSYQKNFNSLIIDNKLKYLTLKFCGINDEGIAQLIKPLKNAFQPVLLHLNVSHNNIGEKGAEQIAAMLRVNRILISLNLGCNKITDLGAKKILSSLQSFRLNQEEISKRRKIYYQYYIIKFKELKESGLSVSPSVETKLLTTKTSSTSTMKLLKGQRSSKSKQRRKLSRSATSLSESEGKFLKSRDIASAPAPTTLMPPIAELSDLVATLDYQSAYHPFVSDTTLEVYEFVCRGNFILNHLNLSFNHLGADTLSDIHAVLTYQLTNGSSIEGLKSITVDGNHFQSDGTEQLQQEIADIFMQKRPRTGSSFPTVSIMTKRDKKRPSRGQ